MNQHLFVYKLVDVSHHPDQYKCLENLDTDTLGRLADLFTALARDKLDKDSINDLELEYEQIKLEGI